MKTQTQNADVIATLEHESRELIRWLDTNTRARQLFDGTLDATTYAHFLMQTYHYVRWTTPLLAHAGQRMARMGRHPVLAELLQQKAQEERGHERWLLADLHNLGWSAASVERSLPCAAVAAYVAWNRFTVEAGSPTRTRALMGTGGFSILRTRASRSRFAVSIAIVSMDWAFHPGAATSRSGATYWGGSHTLMMSMDALNGRASWRA